MRPHAQQVKELAAFGRQACDAGRTTALAGPAISGAQSPISITSAASKAGTTRGLEVAKGSPGQCRCCPADPATAHLAWHGRDVAGVYISVYAGATKELGRP